MTTAIGCARPALFVLAMVVACASHSRGAPASASNTGKPDVEVLKGTWVRPDGGYTIVIKDVTAGGQLRAMYYNPGALPFAKAQASRDGATLRVFFELQAGGYNGSTYELTYDAAANRLRGTYYQAVAKQKFDVYFVRGPGGHR